MSVSAKAAKFPTPCANSECAQALCGPVIHCPFCGVAAQRMAPAPAVADVVLPVAAPLVVAAVASAPAAVVAAPVAASVPAPPETPVIAAQSAAKPKGKGVLKKTAAALLVVASVYGVNQWVDRHDKQQMEQALLTGKECLRQNDFNCVVDNADKVLSKDSSEPRAISLKQQGQAGLARVQKAEADKQTRANAAAAQKAAADQARAEQARVRQQQAQAALEERERTARRQTEEQDLRAQQLREQRAQEQVNQQLRTQEQLARQQRLQEQRAQQRSAPDRRPQGSENFVMPQNLMNGSNMINLPSQNGQSRSAPRDMQMQNRGAGQGQDAAQDRIRSIIQ